jgi:hypothetical protein
VKAVRRTLAGFLLLLSLAGGWLAAQEPYQYSEIKFNSGMNAAVGPFFVGDQPIDLVNGLFDATGFLYPRNAFKLFNGRTRILGNREITGMFRYVRRAEPPFFPGASFFLVADSQFIWQDSSVTDTLLGFKMEPIGTQRGTAQTTSGSAIVGTSPTIASSPNKFLQYVVPKDYFFGGVIDSATYFRIGGRGRIKIALVITDDSLLLDANADTTTASAITNFKTFPAFEIGAQKSFAVNANRTVFGDSTKPAWVFDGAKTSVSFVVDSGRTYVNTTTILRDGSKAWFPNQWVGYWVRFSSRIIEDRAGAGGADSMVRSCWAPITGNDDTSLTLRFDPIYGNSGVTYYIMALPVERVSAEQNMTEITLGGLDSAVISSTTGFNFGHGSSAILCYPLSGFVTDGPNYGLIKMVSAVHADTLFFLDEKFRASLASNGKMALVGNFPIVPRVITTHQERTWMVDQSQSNRIYYSEPLEPGNVAPFNYVDVLPRAGDRIAALSSYKDQLLAYTTSGGIFRVVGDNPSNFVVLPFLENMGTPGQNSRTAFAGDEFFYDHQTGVYVLREFNPVNISDEVKPLLDSIPHSMESKVQLAIFRDHLWIAYAAGNVSRNNRLLSYNIRVPDSWARHSFTKASCFSVWNLAGDSSRLMLGDPDSGLVYQYNDTARVDAYTSTRVKMTLKSGWQFLSQPEKRKRLRGVQLAFDGDTTQAVADVDSLYLYKDFATAAFDTLLFSFDGQVTNYATKDVNGLGYGRLFQMEWRVAPRKNFKFHFGRKKWTDIGF